MATNVVMEALSPTMEEGRLVEWKKQEGEPVAVGDVLAEVETDKAVMELVARAGGTLLKQVVAAGATVPVSQLVAVIGEPGEAVTAPAAPAPKATAGTKDAQATQPAPDRNRPESMPPAPPASQATETAGRSGPPAPAPAGAATEATTVDPSSAAFMSPMISSSANNTAATGVLNAAARAPAAPTGTRSRVRAGGRRSQRPATDAIPAPIWTEGPSRPIE